MYKVLSLAVLVSGLALPGAAVAQVQELPNVPIVTGGWQEKFWTGKDGTKFHYF
jgi:hypothetical protein